MKKKFIISGIALIASFLALYILSRINSGKESDNIFTEVQKGQFEISVISAGELMAESSIDIKGPAFTQGRDIRSTNIKIQDLIPEGTLVKEGDYIATLDRTELNNNLKDAMELLTQLKSKLDFSLLDTTVTLNDRRDMIRNQIYEVEETEMTLKNSKYESPTRIRQAEIAFDKAKRVLEQRQRYYKRLAAQSRVNITYQLYLIKRVERRVKDLEDVLEGFTITAPASGMVIYKRDWRGTKRKSGSMINSFDRIVATLPDLSSMISKTFINEIDISKMKAGQKVAITIDAFPQKKFNGTVSYVANIGEKLLNSSDKVFEVQIKIEGSDPTLRPSMTTGNKIIINTIPDAVYIPIECVQAGTDSIPYVYTKSGEKQIVLMGESNEKNVMIEKGLKPGSILYLNNPENPEKFMVKGQELVEVIREREKTKSDLAGMYRKKTEDNN